MERKKMNPTETAEAIMWSYLDDDLDPFWSREPHSMEGCMLHYLNRDARMERDPWEMIDVATINALAAEPDDERHSEEWYELFVEGPKLRQDVVSEPEVDRDDYAATLKQAVRDGCITLVEPTRKGFSPEASLLRATHPWTRGARVFPACELSEGEMPESVTIGFGDTWLNVCLEYGCIDVVRLREGAEGRDSWESSGFHHEPIDSIALAEDHDESVALARQLVLSVYEAVAKSRVHVRNLSPGFGDGWFVGLAYRECGIPDYLECSNLVRPLWLFETAGQLKGRGYGDLVESVVDRIILRPRHRSPYFVCPPGPPVMTDRQAAGVLELRRYAQLLSDKSMVESSFESCVPAMPKWVRDMGWAIRSSGLTLSVSLGHYAEGPGGIVIAPEEPNVIPGTVAESRETLTRLADAIEHCDACVRETLVGTDEVLVAIDWLFEAFGRRLLEFMIDHVEGHPFF